MSKDARNQACAFLLIFGLKAIAGYFISFQPERDTSLKRLIGILSKQGSWDVFNDLPCKQKGNSFNPMND